MAYQVSDPQRGGEVLLETRTREVALKSVDRNDFLKKPHLH